MKFGLAIPNCREGLYYPPGFASSEQIRTIAREAERLGYSSVWVNDHITPPGYTKQLYAGTANFYDPLVTLSVVSQCTSTVGLALGVAILPLRDPIFLAKQAMTLDEFGGGRVTLGVGLGSYLEEYQAAGREPSQRPRLFSEGVEALHALLTQEKATYDGKLVKFKDIELAPRGHQRPIPLYVGGNGKRSMDKIARWANGWMPASLTPEELMEYSTALKASCSKHGRDYGTITIAPQTVVSIAPSKELAEEKFKQSGVYRHLQSLKDSTFRTVEVRDLESRNLIGTPRQIVERIERYRSVGIEHLAALIFPADRVDSLLHDVNLFSREVIPSFA